MNSQNLKKNQIENTEIQMLMDYIEKLGNELQIDEDRIEVLINQEAEDFFSKYSSEEKSDYLINRFKNSLRDIYRNKIIKKQNFLMDLSKNIKRIEQEYFSKCA